MLEFRGSPRRQGSGVGRVRRSLAVGGGRRSWRAFTWVEQFDHALFPRLESEHVSSGVSRGSLVLKQVEIGDILARRARVETGHVLGGDHRGSLVSKHVDFGEVSDGPRESKQGMFWATTTAGASPRIRSKQSGFRRVESVETGHVLARVSRLTTASKELDLGGVSDGARALERGAFWEVSLVGASSRNTSKTGRSGTGRTRRIEACFWPASLMAPSSRNSSIAGGRGRVERV
jgi:hypothetical protein